MIHLTHFLEVLQKVLRETETATIALSSPGTSLNESMMEFLLSKVARIS